MSLTNDTTMLVQPAYGGGYGGGGMWGGDWSSWIILFLLFGMFGYGGFGGGWGGGFGGGMNGGVGSEVQRGFDHSSVVQKLDGLSQGLCDGFYAQNSALMSGFHGVNSAISDLGYQMASCCCDTQRAIDGVRYDMAREACDTRNLLQNTTRDILDNNNSNTRAIFDFLTQDKIETMRGRIQTLETAAAISNQNAYLSANQEAQTAELIRRLGIGCPQPAFLVNAPTPINFPTNGCGQVSFGNNCGYSYNNGCGCAA